MRSAFLAVVSRFMGAEEARLLRKTTLVSGAGKRRLAVRTLTFSRPKSLKDVRLDLGDILKIVIPEYKPKSYSISAVRKGEFDITVKIYFKGRASGYLDRLSIGDSVKVFVRRPYVRSTGGTHVGAVAFGVGITEALPVSEAELEKSNHVTLLWACRTRDDMFWDARIKALSARFPRRFKILRILSREKRSDALYGRIDEEVLKRAFAFKNVSASDIRFLRVGTKAMMRAADGHLKTLGFDVPGRHSLLRRRNPIQRAFVSNPDRG